MADTLEIKITAADGASKTFLAVERSATSAGRAIEGAGKRGKAGMDQLSKSAETTEQRLKRLEERGTKIGASMGSFATVLSTVGNAYRNQERQIDGITRAYGDQSDIILQMTEDMQDFTRYSNDAARESAMIASSLAQNYDLSAQQVEQLVERSADLAQIFGISLPDAVQRTSAALRGEGESAEALALNMSDAAIAARALEAGITNWNVPGALSEAEKAAFRFTVFMEDSQYAMGAATEAAEGAGGALRGFINDAQDTAAAVGGTLGPIADMAAELQGVALWLPIVGAGLGKVAANARMIGLLRNPLLSIGAAATVGTVAFIGMIERTQQMVQASKDLDEVMRNMRLDGLDQAVSQLQGVRAEVNGLIGDLEEGGPFGIGGTSVPSDVKRGISETLALAFSDSRVDTTAFVEWVNTELARIGDDQELQIAFLRDLADPDVLTRFRKGIDDTNAAMQRLTATTRDFVNLFADVPAMLDDMRISGDGALADDLEALHTRMIDTFTPSQQEVAAANGRWLDVLPAEEQSILLKDLTAQTELSTDRAAALGDAWSRIQTNMASGNLDNAAIMADINAILADTTLTADQQAMAIVNLSSNMGQYVDQFAALKDAQVEWLGDGGRILDWWLEYNAAVNSGAASTDGSAEAMKRLQAAADFRTQVGWADEIRDAADALDGALAVFGRIDELGQRSESAGSIAERLVGEPGVWAEIDDMLVAGTISQQEYNEAVTAGHAIQESNVRTQELLNDVRRDQLPLLAEEQEAYEANLARLAELEPAEQRRVLMLQDVATQSQIASLYSTAYAASIGEIPEEVATRMILEAAEADAGLKDILLNLGLIKENADGTISVNFPDAESVTSSINRVTQALVAFMDLTDDGVINGSITLEVLGIEDVDAAEQKVAGIDGTTATAQVEFEAVEPDWAKDGYTGAWGPVKVPVELDWAGAAGGSVLDAARQAMNTVTIDVVANTEQADSAIATTQGAADTLNGTSALVSVNGDNSAAMQSIDQTRGQLSSVDGSSAGIVVTGDNSSALAAIGDIQAYDGDVLARSYHDIVTRYSSTGTPTAMHGGVIGEYAMGGVTIRAGEVGLEMAHFPMGGVAALPHDGLYNVPVGTYISPHNAVGDVEYGGINVTVHVAGSVVAERELMVSVAEAIAPALAHAMYQRRASFGGLG